MAAPRPQVPHFSLGAYCLKLIKREREWKFSQKKGHGSKMVHLFQKALFERGAQNNVCECESIHKYRGQVSQSVAGLRRGVDSS